MAQPENEDAVLQRVREIHGGREPVVSDYHEQQKDYDKGWLNRQTKVLSYIENGERQIGHVYGRLRNFWMSGRWPVGHYEDFVIDGQEVKLLARSGYMYYRHAAAEAVIDRATKETGLVVELGSGMCDTMFTIWAESRLNWPRYVACEFSEAGRRTSRMLAALEPRMKFDARFFDYRKPDFSGIPKAANHAIAYSTHSIEQVDQVSGELIERLCDLAPRVTGLHFEPIGWQFAEDPSRPLVANHKARCMEFKYNENFWALLNSYQDRGLIRILEAVPYWAGLSYNPACKIVWEKA